MLWPLENAAALGLDLLGEDSCYSDFIRLY